MEHNTYLSNYYAVCALLDVSMRTIFTERKTELNSDNMLDFNNVTMSGISNLTNDNFWKIFDIFHKRGTDFLKDTDYKSGYISKWLSKCINAEYRVFFESEKSTEKNVVDDMISYVLSNMNRIQHINTSEFLFNMRTLLTAVHEKDTDVLAAMTAFFIGLNTFIRKFSK